MCSTPSAGGGPVTSEVILFSRAQGGCARSAVQLLVTHGFISTAAWQQALLCPDGMIQLAASCLRCPTVTSACYALTSPTAPRPCAAQNKARRGCACQTTACVQVCQFAPPQDAQARCV